MNAIERLGLTSLERRHPEEMAVSLRQSIACPRYRPHANACVWRDNQPCECGAVKAVALAEQEEATP